jgi:hypothetical protein
LCLMFFFAFLTLVDKKGEKTSSDRFAGLCWVVFRVYNTCLHLILIVLYNSLWFSNVNNPCHTSFLLRIYLFCRWNYYKEFTYGCTLFYLG